MNEIDKAAHDHAIIMRGEDRSDVSDNVNFELMKQAFRAGHSYALSMASDSIRKYLNNFLPEVGSIDETMSRIELEKAILPHWTAAKLSCAKELDEKDKEIERLRDTMKRVRERLRSKSVSIRAKAIMDKEFSKPMTDEEFRKALNNGGQE